jgi:hypothetical protein
MGSKTTASVRRRALGFATGLVLLAAGGAAWAETGSAAEALAQGRRLVQSFEYDAALEQLEGVVRDASATATERVDALELMGVMHFNLRREPRARQMFERLLNLDPGHELADTSYPPRLLAFYGSIRESFMPQQTVRVEAEARQDQPGSGPVRIAAQVAGEAGGVEQAVTLVRAPGQPSFRRALMSRTAGAGVEFSAEVPATDAAGGLEYYVEVQAPSGYTLATAGAEASPLRFDVVAAPPPVPAVVSPANLGDQANQGDQGGDGGESPHRRRWYRSWWFWTIVGVAVAGGAAATAVVVTLPPDQEQGTLGTWSIP